MSETEVTHPPEETSTISVNGQDIEYTLVPEDFSGETVDVILMNADSQSEFEDGLRRKIAPKFWWLSENYQEKSLTQRFRAEITPGVFVDLFNYGENKGLEQIKPIADYLATFYSRLQDKSVWNLASIQILDKDEANRKSGENFRGREFPSGSRFELFPASFEEGYYRNQINCSWLEGAVHHEATHIVLEKDLSLQWRKHIDELGWRHTREYLIQYPGGSTTSSYNERPNDCPTEYASYQADDDRAESVVCFMAQDNSLNDLRHQLIGKVLNEPDNVHIEEDSVSEVEPEYDPISPLKVKTKVTRSRIVSRQKHQGIPTIPLEEFQKMKKIEPWKR